MATPEERFRAFDFENDPQWREYETQLTFPPGRDDLVLKKKAQWFKRSIDPELDITTVTPQAPPPSEATTKAPPSATPSPASAPEPSRPSSTTAPPRAPQTAYNAASTSALTDLVLLLSHVILVIGAVLALQPLSPYLAHRGYAYMSRASLVAHGIRLSRKVGSPPRSLSALKPWMGRITSTSEFFYLICTVMLGQYPSAWIGIAPGAIVAAYHAAAGLRARFGGVPLVGTVHAWLASRQSDAVRMATLLELFTLVALVLGIPRYGFKAAFSSYMYANQLRGRYWSPESRTQHLEAWGRLGMMANPLVARFPALQRATAAGQTWFEAAGQRQAAAPHQD